MHQQCILVKLNKHLCRIACRSRMQLVSQFHCHLLCHLSQFQQPQAHHQHNLQQHRKVLHTPPSSSTADGWCSLASSLGKPPQTDVKVYSTLLSMFLRMPNMLQGKIWQPQAQCDSCQPHGGVLTSASAVLQVHHLLPDPWQSDIQRPTNGG